MWFNVYGLLFLTLIMIPNIVFMCKVKDGFQHKWNPKAIGILEQIGRVDCLFFMVFIIPPVTFYWWSDGVFALYLIVNTFLSVLYVLVWILVRKPYVFRSLALSILPSAIFIFSGITVRAIPLLLFSLIFAPTHILISYKNAK